MQPALAPSVPTRQGELHHTDSASGTKDQVMPGCMFFGWSSIKAGTNPRRKALESRAFATIQHKQRGEPGMVRANNKPDDVSNWLLGVIWCGS